MSNAAAVLNALDFNGRESRTHGIQEAVDALPKSGGTVFLPPGGYRLRRRISLRANVRLKGAGPATVITRPRPVKIPLTRSMKDKDRRVHLKHVRGLRIGDELYVRSQQQYGWNSRHGIIKDIRKNRLEVELYRWTKGLDYLKKYNPCATNWFPAIWIYDSENVTVENLTIDGGIAAHREDRTDFVVAAVHTNRSRNLRVSDVTVRNWLSDGISIQGGENAIVSRCIVENCRGHGFHPGTCSHNSIWTDNIGQNNTRDGFFFCQNVNHAVCKGSLFENNRGNGIGGLTDPDRYNVVSGNICAGNKLNGIDADKSIGNIIQGNICRNNSQREAGRFAGIYLSQHRGTIVKDNLCFDDQKKPTQVLGVVAVDPAAENFIGHNPGCPGG